MSATASSSRSRTEARASASRARPIPPTTSARSRQRDEQQRRGRQRDEDAANESQVWPPNGRRSWTTSTPKMPAASATPGKTSTTAQSIGWAPPALAPEDRQDRAGHRGVGGRQQQQRDAVEEDRFGCLAHGAFTIWAGKWYADG